MRSLVKTYLIFSIILLSLMLFTTQVYATETENLQEQQLQESEEESQDQTQDQEPKETKVINIKEGIYTLSLLDNTNMRQEPTVDSVKILTLPFGIDLESKRKIINDKEEEWYEVTYSGLSGYISAKAVTVEAIDEEEDEEEPESLVNEDEVIEEQAQETNAEENTESSSSVTQLTEQTGVVRKADASNTEVSPIDMPQENNTGEDDKGIRKADFIFWLFLIYAIVGLIILFIIFFRLRYEYIIYRRQILYNNRDRVLKD